MIAAEPIVAITGTLVGEKNASGGVGAKWAFQKCACGHDIGSPMHRDGVCKMPGCGCGVVATTADDLAALAAAIPEDLRAWAAYTSGFWV
jgi:hypothetical protein